MIECKGNTVYSEMQKREVVNYFKSKHVKSVTLSYETFQYLFENNNFTVFLLLIVGHGLGVPAAGRSFHSARDDSGGQRLTAQPPQLREVSGTNQSV